MPGRWDWEGHGEAERGTVDLEEAEAGGLGGGWRGEGERGVGVFSGMFTAAGCGHGGTEEEQEAE